MAAVNQDIVREYFEMHGFLVRQDRKYIMRGQDARMTASISLVFESEEARAGG